MRIEHSIFNVLILYFLGKQITFLACWLSTKIINSNGPRMERYSSLFGARIPHCVKVYIYHQKT